MHTDKRRILNWLKRQVKHVVGACGYEIRGKAATEEMSVTRTSMYGCLQQAFRNGLTLQTVLDVGAGKGTPPLYTLFPDAYHLLFEPLEETVPDLQRIVRNLTHADYILAAAADKPGEVVLHVHPDLFGSSLYKEDENSDVNGIERVVPAVTLDDICQKHHTTGPYLIKIDTQGSELDVLKGSETILQETAFIILELSLFEFFRGGPQFYDCVEFMQKHGFVAYDIFNLQYRLLDHAMSQVDIAFVPAKSPLRTYHFYATAAQRHAQNAWFRNA